MIYINVENISFEKFQDFFFFFFSQLSLSALFSALIFFSATVVLQYVSLMRAHKKSLNASGLDFAESPDNDVMFVDVGVDVHVCQLNICFQYSSLFSAQS